MRDSKSSLSYWERRIRQRSYRTKDGTLKIIPEFALKLSQGGKAVWFGTHLSEKRLAAQKAREIGTFFEVHGLAETVKKFKPQNTVEKCCNLTLNQYVSSIEALSMLAPDTFRVYRKSLRLIVADVFGIRSDDKFNSKSGEDTEWHRRVNAVKLSRLTPEKVERWRVKYVADREGSISAKRSCNTHIRGAKALFSKKITKRLLKLGTIEIPANPFADVEYYNEGDKRYYSKINIHAIIAGARNELKPNKPEVYKVFLLALFAAMRRGEIDNFEWGMIDFTNNIITLRETDCLNLKTEGSAAAIGIDPELAEELRCMMPGATSRFVVDSPNEAKRRPAGCYRCDCVFNDLIEWLRGKGIDTQKPIHTLRKEMGAQIATQHGLYPASVFLRQSSTRVTEQHYACLKRRVETGLGSLLKTEIKVA